MSLYRAHCLEIVPDIYKAFIQAYFCAFKPGIDPGLPQANFIDVIFSFSDYSCLPHIWVFFYYEWLGEQSNFLCTERRVLRKVTTEVGAKERINMFLSQNKTQQ